MVTRRTRLLLLITVALLALPACGVDDDDTSSDPDAGADGSADVDTDADSDTEIGDAGPGNTAIWVAVGFTQTCAVIDGGYVKCWGYGHFGELGYGTDLFDDTDADFSLPSTLPFVRVGGAVAQIEAGINTTCALLADGGVKCWGFFDYGLLGMDIPLENNSTIGAYDVPADYAPVYFGDTAVKQLDVGGGHMCVLLDGGDVRCFGGIDHADLGGPATQLCTGADHSCAVRDDGAVYCWGLGNYGALGYGDTDDVWAPIEKGPVDIGGAAVQVACGYYHTCALLDTGEVVCWGLGDNGQLGYGNTDSVGVTNVPADVGPVDVGAVATQISAGERFTCAILSDGSLKCWGAVADGLGQHIGDDETPAEALPVPVGGTVIRVDGGQAHVCVLLETGAVRCWGDNGWGQLGYGSNIDYVGDDETPAEAGDVPLM